MSSQRKHVFPDPITGKIELPNWLIKIKEQPAVRRMLFIRQLGLKAYIDFPGAIHTRYSHALGVMFLANKITDLLARKMNEKGNNLIGECLIANKDELIAAGFFHDIAHGPFSHAVDFAMQQISGNTHEKLAEDVITKYLPSDLANLINTQQVIKLIQDKHDYPFLNKIISGPIDIDKLDYLLRDAYHVGLKYSFDLDYFLSSYTILGDQNSLDKCKLGIENTTQAIATAEIFLVMWKSMYDLVYHVEGSRIAEKMLEKAILLNKDNSDLQKLFSDTQSFLELTDDELLKTLSQLGGQTSELIDGIKTGNIYQIIDSKELNQEQFEMNPKLIASLRSAHISEISDRISKQLNKQLNQPDYTYIVDIISSRVPGDIQIDSQDEKTGEYAVLREKSPIVGAIQETQILKVYASSSIKGSEGLNMALKEIIEGLSFD